jgi:hypothetical protein
MGRAHRVGRTDKASIAGAVDEDRRNRDVWIAPRAMNTRAGSRTAWTVIRIEARSQIANALRLIPAEHCSRNRWVI